MEFGLAWLATDKGDKKMTNIERRQFLKRAGTATAMSLVGLGATTTSASAHTGRISIISTRGTYDENGNLKSGEDSFAFETAGVPGEDTGCASELTVYVHGFENGHEQAVAGAHDTLHHLMNHGYGGHVSAFSWDSDVPNWDWNDWGGFGDAQQIAQANGHALAHFLYRQEQMLCSSTTLRLISHSLGSQVVFSALRTLNGWWDSWDQVATVHLLGAANDDETPTYQRPDTYYAIRDDTGATFNYHNREDYVLGYGYEAREGDQALGRVGNWDWSGDTPPNNYHEVDVTSQWGDDHGRNYYVSNCADEILYHMANDHLYD